MLSRCGRERVRKEDNSNICNSRDWKTNDAIIRHGDIRKNFLTPTDETVKKTVESPGNLP